MKKILLLVLPFINLNITSAFFGNQKIEIQTQTIQIQIENDTQARVSISETIKNPTKTPQNISFFFPFLQKADQIKYFVELEGQEINILSGKTQKANFLWDQFLQTKNPGILKMFPAKKILTAPPISIKANETKTIKITFLVTPEKQDHWNALEIPVNKTPIKNTKISFQNLQKNIPHFFHTFPNGALLNKEKDSFSYFFQKENFKPESAYKFVWNTEKKATAEYKNFSAIFSPLPLQKTFSNIFFLIDKSGSMSDNAWTITEELVQFLLNYFPTDSKINSGLFSETLTKTSEKFEPNTSDIQKKILETIRNTFPIGKTNFYESTKNIPKNDLTVLITDDPNIKNISEEKNDWLVLHFEPETISVPNLWAKGISIVPLWRNHYKLIQQDEIIDQLKHIRSPIINRTENQNNHIYQPKNISFFDSETQNIFITETQEFSGKNWKYFEFIPTIWGQYRLSEILEQYKNTKSAPLEAFFSIVQNFGIETEISDTKSILSKTKEELSEEIFKLRTQKQVFSNRISIPKRTTQKEELDIFLHPYAEAHETLFKKFPEEFSKYSSEETSFCLPTRCVFISLSNKKTKLSNIDKTFWKIEEVNHWGYEYLKKFVEEEIFVPNKISFSLEPENPVLRGEFAHAVYKYYSWKSPKKSQEKFSDVSEAHKYSEAIQFLRDQNIFQGYEDNTFRPNNPISRSEAVKTILLLHRKIPDLKKIPKIFQDTPGWESGWAHKAFEIGMVQGEEKNGKRYFHPHRPVKKAEMAKIIMY